MNRHTTTHHFLIATAAALTLALIASGCANHRSIGTRVDDAAITAKIKSKVAAEPALNPFEIDVDTSDGVVRLSGTVESDADRDAIERVAERTRGVSDVINSITLGDPTIGENTSDTVIGTKVKARLAAHSDINPFRIDVDVVRGVVTLSGSVDDTRTRELAEQVAEAVRGVQSVDNRIDIERSHS